MSASSSPGEDPTNSTGTVAAAAANLKRIETLQRDAAILRKAGLQIVPLGVRGKGKAPWVRWHDIATPGHVTHNDEVRGWIADPRTIGWGVISGEVSKPGPTTGISGVDGLMVLDVEKAGVSYPAIVDPARAMPDHARRESVAGGIHGFVWITDTAAVPDWSWRGQHIARVKSAAGDAVLLSELRGARNFTVLTGPGRPALREDFMPVVMSAREFLAAVAPGRVLHDAGTDPKALPRDAVSRGGGLVKVGDTGWVLRQAVLAEPDIWPLLLDPGWTLYGAPIPDYRDGLTRVCLQRPDYGKPADGESANALGSVLVVFSETVPWAPPDARKGLSALDAVAYAWFDGKHHATMVAAEAAARDLVVDGVMPAPGSPFAAWPAWLLEEVHANNVAYLGVAGIVGAGSDSGSGSGSGLSGSSGDTEPTGDVSVAAAREAGALEGEVFGYSPLLETMRQAARARSISPWSTLGSWMAHVAAEVPPHFVIPPMVGSDASLNFAVALVGPSGTGKSASGKVVREVVSPAGTARRIGPGTGEGLIMSFMQPDPAMQGRAAARAPLIMVPDPRALLYADEVGQIGALNQRNGSTQGSILRSLLTGEDVHTTNAELARRRHLPGGEYRLAMVVGVQPALADVLLRDSEEGGPQRFVWLPTPDPDMPDVEPDWPGNGALVWSFPDPLKSTTLLGSGVDPHHVNVAGRDLVRIGFPDAVWDEVRSGMRARIRGTGGGDAGLDGHLMLCRLKVAAICALMHGRLDVSEADWKWSGAVMAVSNATRAAAGRAVAEVRVGERIARGRGRAVERAAEMDVFAEQAAADARSVWAVVDGHSRGEAGAARRHKSGWVGCPPNCIPVGVHRLRGNPDRLAAAIRWALESDWIVLADGDRYRPGQSQPVRGS
jgi:hypothetical protein